MAVAALVFDAYGTLFDVHSVAARCEAFWPGCGTRLAALWRAKQLEWTWQRSLARRWAPFEGITADALAWACESLGLALEGARVEALLDEYRRLALFPDAAASLAQLASRGRCLAILTNGSSGLISPLLAHHGLGGAFAAVLSAEEVRSYKPDPAVYALAPQRLGLPAQEIGFVSANGWDAAGAAAYGLHSYWINRTGAPLERLGAQPAAILGSLAQLLERAAQ